LCLGTYCAFEPEWTTPREESTITDVDRKALAWRAEAAARKRRFRPWVSKAWWNAVLFSEFSEHDPVYRQRELFEEKSRGLIDNGRLHAWERQWQHQQKMSSWAWYRMVKDWSKRTPEECTSALCADSQIILMSIQILSDMVIASKKEDEVGVVHYTIPMILSCLLDCVIGLEDYIKSPAFLGTNDAISDHEYSISSRKDLFSIRDQMDQSIYKLTGSLGKQLENFPYLEDQANLLASYFNLER